MFKVQVAIDGSEHGEDVLDTAVQGTASMASAELHLAHVRDAPAVAEPAAPILPGQAVIDADAARWRAAGATAAGAEVGGYVTSATRGMGAMAKLVLGSVATKVVHLSEIPVTLVH